MTRSRSQLGASVCAATPLTVPPPKPITALICCEYFDGRGYGQSLSARGFSVHLPGRIQWEAIVRAAPSSEENLNAPIHYLPQTRIEDALRLSRALLPVMWRLRPQIVHMHGIWTGLIGLIPVLQRMGAKVIVSVHGMASSQLRHSYHNWKKAAVDLTFHSRCLRQADRFHAFNVAEADAIRKYLRRSDLPISIISNGVDPIQPPPTHARSRKPVFLHCGRFHHGKNIHGLLEAWERANIAERATLVLAGDGEGPYAHQIRARAEALPGVELTGYVKGERKDELHRRADYSVLFSDSEGQPMAILEGLAYALPPVLSPGCCLNEAATTFGWLACDVAELGRALAAAADLPEDAYEERSRAALEYANVHHDWKRIGELMARTYEGMLEGG